ncbi:hypothetical protein FHS38_001916 [Streptomyces netropsis]|uniref:Uncharacterized protein n=1 Tax=Streptomyces netropsis TaxID=55404 RepID=A0A7W7PDR2_STRNE|nr:hypothetical protein [Streptomyces netropsis]GGR17997.1 hypothetical protein GCM10010219_24060 [Streptomyces netropsis]
MRQAVMSGPHTFVCGPEAGATALLEAVPRLKRSPRAPSVIEGDYLSGQHTKIYVGQSRHWVLVWLWFLL